MRFVRFLLICMFSYPFSLLSSLFCDMSFGDSEGHYLIFRALDRALLPWYLALTLAIWKSRTPQQGQQALQVRAEHLVRRLAELLRWFVCPR